MKQQPVQDPGEELLKQAFQKHLSQQNEENKVQISKEEADSIEKAFEAKEFRDLMAEYVSEISDPKYRAEQDEYLRQLEKQNEVPDGKDVLRPETGFVMKFKYSKKKKNVENTNKATTSNPKQPKAKEKLFVNIVHAKQVCQPTYSSSKAVDKNGRTGRNWSIPYTLGPMRMEADNKKSLVPTFDCCFHPLALMYATKSVPYRDLIATTVREGVTQQFKAVNESVNIDEQYLVLKGVQYKSGKPPAMMIKAKKISPSSSVSTNSDSTTHHLVLSQKDNIAKTQRKGESTCAMKKGFLLKVRNNERKKKNNEAVSIKSKTGLLNRDEDKTADSYIVPDYEIVERGEFDMADHTIEGLKRPSSRPKLLIIKIRLRGIKSVKQIELDVSEERLVLASLGSEPKYNLSVKLPYPVISDDGTAKFDKDSHTLDVTLPVIKQDIDFPYPSSHSEEVVITPEKSNQNGNDSVSSSPVIVKHEECVNDLDESPVIVENPWDHSRWLEKENKGQKLRDEFATDEIIPTLSTTEVITYASMNKEEIESNINEQKATITKEQKDATDYFQVVDYIDDEGNGTFHSNQIESGDKSIPCNDARETSKQQPSLYCESSLIFELD